MQKTPKTTSDTYQEQYFDDFVSRWDQLIDWDQRAKGEGEFFVQQLRARGVRTVLDVATGTGFHSVSLLKAGFQVTSCDGAPEMLRRALKNSKERNCELHARRADWRALTRDVRERFDAVVCLGNSFTHLFSEADRRRTLYEYYRVLNENGILVLDQRNYDAMFSRGYRCSHKLYYAGHGVSVGPEVLERDLTVFKYEFPDGKTFRLNMYPLRRQYLERLIQEAGFLSVQTYGDFRPSFDPDEAEFLVHVAEKRPGALRNRRLGN
jgi:SAM-dependent methyltransferase